jgi:DNA-binding GntR family transcriptional regulator
MAAARVDAMKAFIAAVAKGDPATADEAMQAYHHVCGLSEPDSDDY